MIFDALTAITGDWLPNLLKQIPNEFISVLPIALPVVIAVMALRKGISFLLCTLRGA